MNVDLTIIIGKIVDNFALILGAIGLFIVQWRANSKLDSKLDVVAQDARKTELNTNSMKDALVAATRSLALKEGHATGVAAEKGRQETESATLATGVELGHAEATAQAQRDEHVRSSAIESIK